MKRLFLTLTAILVSMFIFSAGAFAADEGVVVNFAGDSITLTGSNNAYVVEKGKLISPESGNIKVSTQTFSNGMSTTVISGLPVDTYTLANPTDDMCTVTFGDNNTVVAGSLPKGGSGSFTVCEDDPSLNSVNIQGSAGEECSFLVWYYSFNKSEFVQFAVSGKQRADNVSMKVVDAGVELSGIKDMWADHQVGDYNIVSSYDSNPAEPTVIGENGLAKGKIYYQIQGSDASDGMHGTISPEEVKVVKGSDITIKIEPYNNCEISNLEVDYAKIAPVESYTFTNVRSDHNIVVEFSWVNPFTDVTPNDWFYDDVRFCNIAGICEGVSDTSFAPNATLTRAMLITMLWRSDGSPKPESSQVFTDVPSDAWYSDAVLWGVEKGITNGVTPTTFAPMENITREQMIVFLYRYMKNWGYNYLWNFDPELDILDNYSDKDEISPYALKAMAWGVENGIIEGRGGSNLNPKDTATRAETAAIINRSF